MSDENIIIASSNNNINTYNTYLNGFISRIPNYQYMFEISKCCEYTELITEYKDKTLADLYKTIACVFGQSQPIGLLYAVDQTNKTKMLVPNDPNVTVRQFVVSNRPFFMPIYPIPMNIVYKLYYDDGPCHKQMDCCSNKKNNDMNKCENANCPYFNEQGTTCCNPCIIHGPCDGMVG